MTSFGTFAQDASPIRRRPGGVLVNRIQNDREMSYLKTWMENRRHQGSGCRPIAC